MATHIDAKNIRDRFNYNPETGALTKKYKSFSAWFGIKHKCNNGKTYLRAGFSGVYIYAHRIIWVYMTGEQPDTIDHIDGNGLNNKWENLRSVAHRENGKNQKLHSTNTSGFSGVTYRKDCGRWRARIMVDDAPINLGTYGSKVEAINARKLANIEYGFHENHGKRAA